MPEEIGFDRVRCSVNENVTPECSVSDNFVTVARIHELAMDSQR